MQTRLRAMLGLVGAVAVMSGAPWIATSAHAQSVPTTNVNVGAYPIGVAVNPVTNRIYVASVGGKSVSVVDGASNAVLDTISIGFQALSVTVNPITNSIYVGGADPTTNTLEVTVINGQDDTFTFPAALGAGGGTTPFSMLVDPADRRLFIGNPAASDVLVSSASGLSTIPVGAQRSTSALALDPNTRRLYVASGSVAVVDATSNNLLTTIDVGFAPDEIALIPNRNRLYAGGINKVAVVDTATNALIGRFDIAIGEAPGAMAVNPVTNRLYATDQFMPTLSILDVSTDTPRSVGSYAIFGGFPLGLAVNPTTSRAYGTAATPTGQLEVIQDVLPVDQTPPVTIAAPQPNVLPAKPLLKVTGTGIVTTATGNGVGTVPVTCWNTTGVALNLSATDAGSGVASLTYAVTGAPTTTVNAAAAQLVDVTPGRMTVTYAATDRAGNQEVARSETLVIGAGYACAFPTPTFTLPETGNLLVNGMATTAGKPTPLTFTLPLASAIGV